MGFVFSYFRWPGSILAGSFLMAATAGAAQFSSIFTDDMVLQRDRPLPIWGSAEPGEKVTVQFGSHTMETEADTQGQWTVELPAMPANEIPQTLTARGKSETTLKNVVVGEVWVCVGQSNMLASAGRRPDSSEELKPDPLLRYFGVSYAPDGLTPKREIVGQWPSKWRALTPPSMNYQMSGVALSFAMEMRQVLGCPVGVIVIAMGDSTIEAWMSMDSLESNPAFAKAVESFRSLEARFPELHKNWKEQMAAFEVANAEWKAVGAPQHEKEMAEWRKAEEKAKAEGSPIPPKPVAKVPIPQNFPNGGSHTPTLFFNGMVNPVIPFAARGFLFYQGESNAPAPQEYAEKFRTLIRDYRSRWNDPEKPFLFVQLPNFEPPQKLDWALLREAQAQALQERNTGMAVTIDIGDPVDIHPKNKWEVGARLALVARKVAYGEDLVFSGPTYKTHKAEGKSLRITFDNTAPGLQAGKSGDAAELLGFEIAGDDNQWHAASAKIDADSVLLSAEAVPNPVQARYAWANNPACNFYNKSGLPAAPFRTSP
jgi:sialate O-acetylesterase